MSGIVVALIKLAQKIALRDMILGLQYNFNNSGTLPR
jgi:hypothetical protein